MVPTDRDVAPIEQRMNVGAKQQAIVDSVDSAVTDRFDMRSLEHRECLLSSHCAAPFVNVGNQYSECPLAESLTDWCRLAEHGPFEKVC